MTMNVGIGTLLKLIVANQQQAKNLSSLLENRLHCFILNSGTRETVQTPKKTVS